MLDTEPHGDTDAVRFPVAEVLLQGLGLGVFAEHLVADGEMVGVRVTAFPVADAQPVPESVRERDDDAVSEKMAETDAVVLSVSVDVAQDVAAADADTLLESEKALLELTLAVGCDDTEINAVPVLANVTDAVSVALGDAQADVDGDVVPVAVNDELPVCETEGEADAVRTGVSLGEKDTDVDCDEHGDGLVVIDSRAVIDAENDVVVDGDNDPEIDGEPLALPLVDGEGVAETCALIERAELRVAFADAVVEAHALRENDDDDETDADLDCEGDVVAVSDVRGDGDTDLENVGEGVLVADRELVTLTLPHGVGDRVKSLDGDPVVHAVVVRDCSCVPLAEADREADTDALGERVAPATDAVGDVQTVAVRLRKIDVDGEVVPDADEAGDTDTRGDREGDGDGDEDASGECDPPAKLALKLADDEVDGLSGEDGDAETDPLLEADDSALLEYEFVPLVEPVHDGDPVADGDWSLLAELTDV